MEIICIDNFKSLYSTKEYNKNEIIYKLTGEILSEPTRTSIEINENQHIEDEYGQFMNHAFDPTCKIENGCIVTLKKITQHTELNFDYNSNESKMSCPFIDNLTKKNVKGKIYWDEKKFNNI